MADECARFAVPTPTAAGELCCAALEAADGELVTQALEMAGLSRSLLDAASQRLDAEAAAAVAAQRQAVRAVAAHQEAAAARTRSHRTVDRRGGPRGLGFLLLLGVVVLR